MSTATQEKPTFKVPAASAASPAKPEPAKSTGPRIQRPFQPSDLCGFSDDDLRAVLRFDDVIDPKGVYYPRDIPDFTSHTEDEARDFFKSRAADGYPVICDVRGTEYNQSTFGRNILEWVQRCHIKPHFSEYALAVFRRKHPTLFAEPVEPNLIERMRIDKSKIEAEKAAAERQKAAAILNKKWEEVAEILSRFLVPTDGDAARMLDLSKELNVDEAELDRLWRWLKSVHHRQQRLDAARAKGARFDPKSDDLTRLRKWAAARPAFFDVSGEYPKLRFPPAMTD